MSGRTVLGLSQDDLVRSVTVRSVMFARVFFGKSEVFRASGRQGPRLGFFQQADVADDHALIYRLTHVIDG